MAYGHTSITRQTSPLWASYLTGGRPAPYGHRTSPVADQPPMGIVPHRGHMGVMMSYDMMIWGV